MMWRASPSAVLDRFEVSECQGCRFDSQTVPPNPDIDWTEVVFSYEAITRAYYWRVTSIFPDGDEIVSATWSLKVLAFDPFHLYGQVTDSTTGQPIQGVKVETVGGGISRRRFTDSTGEYSERQAVVGDVTVTFSKAGYETGVVEIYSEVTFELNAELDPSP